ncbi:hypothetical protein PVA44_06185 [Entomospira nematocerorum]|uniref:Uncharacterized protein n=1 Tax=Entomospira nematocerorum TaxID=2719987 RepID=A0A968GEQ0_9SPIO|nr:hypothetical protein [Entomospira nematocera]NIZ46391.1 hypothetical protein [Entomospira nematocera]WDI33805.1 hypothetical protein PVA44_06185 [Entomospira nematocera]
MKQRQTILDSYSLSLLLFLYALLIPAHLAFGGWIFILCWSLLTIIALPRAFYHLDRIHLKRDVSIAMVVLCGLAVMTIYLVIGRVFYLDIDNDIQGIPLFLLLSVLIARIENVYESRELSLSPGRIVFTSLIVLLLFTLTRYTLLWSMSILHDLGIVGVESWRFWHAPTGRLFIIGFWVLGIDSVIALISTWRGE